MHLSKLAPVPARRPTSCRQGLCACGLAQPGEPQHQRRAAMQASGRRAMLQYAVDSHLHSRPIARENSRKQLHAVTSHTRPNNNTRDPHGLDGSGPWQARSPRLAAHPASRSLKYRWSRPRSHQGPPQWAPAVGPLCPRRARRRRCQLGGSAAGTAASRPTITSIQTWVSRSGSGQHWSRSLLQRRRPRALARRRRAMVPPCQMAAQTRPARASHPAQHLAPARLPPAQLQ
jgi:hypothetical protein